MNLNQKNSIDIAVFTTKFVLDEKRPVTYVTLNIEDGSWEFFSDDEFDDFESVAKVIGFNEILEIDPTLRELVNLEPGHVASRRNIDDVWVIKKKN